jgi:hypothetical protein
MPTISITVDGQPKSVPTAPANFDRDRRRRPALRVSVQLKREKREKAEAAPAEGDALTDEEVDRLSLSRAHAVRPYGNAA